MFLLQSSSDILTLKSPSLFTDHSLPLSRRPPRVVFIVTVMQMVTPNLYPDTSQVTHGISWHLTNEIWTRWRDGMNRSEMIEMFKSWQCERTACGGIVEICDSLLQRSLLLGSKSCKEPCDGSSSRSCESQTMTLASQVGNSGLHRDGNLEQAVTSGNKR